MGNPDPRELLNVPLFQGLAPGELATLASWFEVQEYPAGRVPVHEHQSGYVFYVLDRGQARAEVDGHVLEVLEPGSVFGEMAFFMPNARRSANIVSDTGIRVFSMFGTRFREMQQGMPIVQARLEELVEKRRARLQASHDEE